MGMRGMMVTTKGEDYMLQAEAKGLPDRVMFAKYAVRNSLLPHLTGLALSLGIDRLRSIAVRGRVRVFQV